MSKMKNAAPADEGYDVVAAPVGAALGALGVIAMLLSDEVGWLFWFPVVAFSALLLACGAITAKQFGWILSGPREFRRKLNEMAEDSAVMVEDAVAAVATEAVRNSEVRKQGQATPANEVKAQQKAMAKTWLVQRELIKTLTAELARLKAELEDDVTES